MPPKDKISTLYQAMNIVSVANLRSGMLTPTLRLRLLPGDGWGVASAIAGQTGT